MFKKMIAICLAFILVVSMAVMPVFADVNSASIVTLDKKEKNDDAEKMLKKFFDSDEFKWAEKAIEKMGAMGILNGVGNGLFKPQNKVTHAEAIAMVIKLVGQQKQAEAIKNQPAYFKGLSDKWSYGYLQLALDLGIIIPQEDGKFNTNSPAKRHDVAKYIIRALGLRDEALRNMNVNLKEYFNDGASVPKNSIGYVFVISQKGIMQGSNNEFKPNEPITRAEMAVLLDKAEGKADVPIGNTSRTEGTIVSFDPLTLKLKIVVNRQDVTYDVLPSAPVYHNSTYHPLSYLKQGDVVKVILDSQNRVIFVELKQVAQTPSTDGKLAIQTVQYENLPQVLKERVDVLKTTENYVAYKHNQNIYLIATMGLKTTGGYGIDIKDVYLETVQTNKFNLKAVVAFTLPNNNPVTQANTFPYEVVKLSYNDGIEKVNFVTETNSQFAQASINTIDNIELITGTIYHVIPSGRTIYIQENNGSFKSYEIPTNAQITLAGQAVALSSLTKDMPVVITKVNNTIYSVAAQYQAPVVEKINGKVDTVDITNRVIRVLGSNNRYSNYTIPTEVQVTYNGSSIAWTAIIKDMPIEITKTNNAITAVALGDAVATVEGKILAVDATLKTITVLENNRATYTYTIIDGTPITLDGNTATLSSLIANMNVVITKTNAVISRVAAVSAVETVSGVIDSINTTSRVIAVKTSNNTVTQYQIPDSNITITLNNSTITDLSLLRKDMPIVITRRNGLITNVAVTNTVETKSGKIYSVNVSDRVIRVQENANTINAYPIPVDAPITVDTAAKSLTDLARNMNIVITRTNGIVTKVEATNSIETVQGVLITTTVDNGKTFISVKVGNTFNQYEITATTSVIYNNNTIAIQNMPLNTTITIKIINGTVSEVRN